MAAVRDGGFKVSVPIMINSNDPKSLSIFSFSLSANVIYNENKSPVCINLNVDVNGWDTAVSKHLENIPTKVIIPRDMGIDRKGSKPSVNGASTTAAALTGNAVPESQMNTIEEKLNRTNTLLLQMNQLLQNERQQAICLPSCSNSNKSDIEFSSFQAPNYEEIEKLRPVFQPCLFKPKEAANEREPLKMTIKRPNGGSVLTAQLNNYSTADKNANPLPTSSNESPLIKIAKISSLEGEAPKATKLDETLAYLMRRSNEYSEKKIKEGQIKDKINNLTCTICSEDVIINKYSLTHHLYRHTKSPLFKCPHCDVTSNFSHSIISHIRSIHQTKSPYEYTDNSLKFDTELSEIAFKAFFDYKKFAETGDKS